MEEIEKKIKKLENEIREIKYQKKLHDILVGIFLGYGIYTLYNKK